jgi:hypothetical protein
MAQRKKWDPEKMKTAIEALRNKDMGDYKASRIFNVPQTKLQRYVKERQESSSEVIKTEMGRKQVLLCEAEYNVAEHSLLMERKFLA